MPSLIKLFRKVHDNYEKYLSNGDLNALENSIRLYEKIQERDIQRNLQKANVFELEGCNNVLFLVAKTYTAYVFAKRNELTSKQINRILSKATKCYNFISHYVEQIPPFSLPKELGQQNTAAQFYKRKMRFHQAEMKLFFIKKQSLDDASATLASDLNTIIAICSKFKKLIKDSYRDPYLREALNIDDELIGSIDHELEEARELLGQISLENTASSSSNITSMEIENSDESKGKAKAPHAPEDEDFIHELEEDLPSSSASISELAQDTDVSSREIPSYEAPTNMQSESGLEILSTLALNFLPLNLESMSIPKEIMIVETSPFSTQPSTTSSSDFSAQPAQWTNDSDECCRLLDNWSELYFAHQEDIGEQMKKALIFEKLAHILLLAAGKLQQSSLIFQGKNLNPAMHLGVQFLLKSVELAVNTPYAATAAREKLSRRYAELLKPFTIVPFLKETLHSNQYLTNIGRRLAREERLIDLNHTTINAAVTNVFEALAQKCSSEDYETIKQICFESIKSASNRLTTQFHSSNFSFA
ncbi:Uncharacterised protein [Legionella lansingensis]|uniref:Uncharacterized protein n=1 Tax=Legionella lansingensis TaxID=45067 RepID=A0A0W0VU21_9GAMM|nr:hypothetical protein [Legionella lansingensis]KTD23578.1 hypothetical protein Llan_0713 [Legionella lansingensis]SNV52324.1 Uncharacterised protein [Legionella lansingensis]